MKVLLNLAKGFRQSASLPTMILTLYALNLLLSLVLAVPLIDSLEESFGSSVVSERMAEVLSEEDRALVRETLLMGRDMLKITGLKNPDDVKALITRLEAYD